jgi:GntR family transcriptional regulator
LGEKKNVYEYIVSELKRLIDVGAIRKGEKLPSVREFAIERKVNPNTVAKAYTALENEGVIQIIPKKGAYVVGQESERVSKAEEVKRTLRLWKASGLSEQEIMRELKEVFNGEIVK